IGQCIGRGTIFSIIAVMFVLPQMLLLGEKIIDRTSFAISMPLKLEKMSGLMRVDGVVRGRINGTVTGEIHGYIRGDANLLVNMGKMEQCKDDGLAFDKMIETEAGIVAEKGEEGERND
ncbi:MAG: RND transporter, partial [Lachnospiraceae bacterium]|nr:RND transporter [Lachnospiraceae bacterium]